VIHWWYRWLGQPEAVDILIATLFNYRVVLFKEKVNLLLKTVEEQKRK